MQFSIKIIHKCGENHQLNMSNVIKRFQLKKMFQRSVCQFCKQIVALETGYELLDIKHKILSFDFVINIKSRITTYVGIHGTSFSGFVLALVVTCNYRTSSNIN